jgi:hypothetical protein
MTENTKLFVINSKDRLSHSSSSTDCVFQFNAKGAKSCTPVFLTMPLSQYNINSTNNSIHFQTDSNVYDVTLIPGNYDVYDFIHELESALNEALPGFIVEYSNISMKLTITHDTTQFRFAFGTYTTNSSAYIMGFNPVDGELEYSHSSDNAIDLSLPLFICCNILEFSKDVETTNGTCSTFVFPSKGNGSDILLYSPSTDYHQCACIYENNIQSIRVRFTHPNGEQFENNNNDWIMVLKLCY